MTILNFGIEMQLSDLNIGNIINNTLYAPSGFVVYQLDDNPTLLAYADAETGLKTRMASNRQIDSYQSYSELSVLYSSLDSGGKKKKDLVLKVYPRTEEFEQLYNDAEFIATFVKMEEVSPLDMNTLLGYLTDKCIQSISRVLDYLKETDQYLLQKATGEPRIGKTKTTRSSTRTRTLDWTFKKLFKVNVPVELKIGKGIDPNSLVFFTKDKDFEIQESTFHIQSTIGVPLSDAWQVMLLLAINMMNVKHLPMSEKRDMMSIIEIEQEMDRSRVDPMVGSIAPLLAYWIKTRGYRKKFGFIIRHMMMELLKLLDSSQFAILLEFHPLFQMNQDLLVMVYEQPPFVKKEGETLEEMSKRKFVYRRDVENVEVSSTFPLHPNGLDTFVLIEFRFMTQLLNSICRKNTKDLLRHLSLSNLQKVKSILLKKK